LLIKVKIGHQYDFLDSVCHEWIIELLGTNINRDDSVPWKKHTIKVWSNLVINGKKVKIMLYLEYFTLGQWIQN